jgi:hypothetical protein
VCGNEVTGADEEEDQVGQGERCVVACLVRQTVAERWRGRALGVELAAPELALCWAPAGLLAGFVTFGAVVGGG